MDWVARIKTATPSLYQLRAILVGAYGTKTLRFSFPFRCSLGHAARLLSPRLINDQCMKRYNTSVMSQFLDDKRMGNTVLMNDPCEEAIESMVGEGGRGLSPSALQHADDQCSASDALTARLSRRVC